MNWTITQVMLSHPTPAKCERRLTGGDEVRRHEFIEEIFNDRAELQWVLLQLSIYKVNYFLG